MTDEIKQSTETAKAVAPTPPPAETKPAASVQSNRTSSRGPGRGGQGRGPSRGPGRGGQGRGPGRGQGRGRPGDVPVESDYEEKNLEISRVTRVTKGGKRMRFRVLTVIGNRKGRVGYGLAKGRDIALAVGKSTAQARKGLITVPLVNDTIPFPISAKFGAAKILLKPAPKGTGVRAGGAVRVVLELAGVPNVVSKILGSSNKVNNVKATFDALRRLKSSSKSGTEVSEKDLKSETKQNSQATPIAHDH